MWNRTREHGFPPGTYHTDGKRLLRIVGEAGRAQLRLVENCRTLDLILIPADELEQLGLRPIGLPSAEGAKERSPCVDAGAKQSRRSASV